jgi:hypothetical protein
LNPVESSESEKSFEKSSAAEKSEKAHFKAPVQITPESQNNPNQNQNQQGKKRRMLHSTEKTMEHKKINFQLRKALAP